MTMLTVKQLITELKKMPQDKKVVINYEDFAYGYVMWVDFDKKRDEVRIVEGKEW